MIAVSNSGPLIHLAKVGCLDLLNKLFEHVIISEVVYNETVDKGLKENYPDAVIIKKAIEKGFIRVEDKITKKKGNISSSQLHRGEIETINLAISLSTDVILLDDEEARIFAKGLNLKVKGTLGIIIDSFRKKIITRKKALRILDELNKTMYLSADIYSFVLNCIMT